MTDLSRHGFDDLQRDQLWSSILLAAAESTFLLDLPDAARAIRRLLDPYIDQVAFSGLWVAGPIAHGVALAAAACNDPDTDALFEQALSLSDRLEAPALRARTEEARAAVFRRWDPHPLRVIDLRDPVEAPAWSSASL
jgi:hypothetical protein